jgi:hypothetical protein
VTPLTGVLPVPLRGGGWGMRLVHNPKVADPFSLLMLPWEHDKAGFPAVRPEGNVHEAVQLMAVGGEELLTDSARLPFVW